MDAKYKRQGKRVFNLASITDLFNHIGTFYSSVSQTTYLSGRLNQTGLILSKDFVDFESELLQWEYSSLQEFIRLWKLYESTHLAIILYKDANK